MNIFDLDLRFQVNSVEQPIKRNSVGSGYVSHRWTSSFDNHLDNSIIVFKKCTTETHLEKSVCWWVRDPHLPIAQPPAFSFQLVNDFLPCTSFLCPVHFVLQCCLSNVTLQSLCPKDREQAVHPCAIQHPKK